MTLLGSRYTLPVMPTPKRKPLPCMAQQVSTPNPQEPEQPAIVRRKAQDQRKQTQLHIRITEAQKKALEHAAARKGLDLSAWVRMTLLEAAGALPK